MWKNNNQLDQKLILRLWTRLTWAKRVANNDNLDFNPCILSSFCPLILTKRYCHEFWLLLITTLMQIHACKARYFLIYFRLFFCFVLFLSMAICLVHMAVQYIIPPHAGLMVTPCLPVPCCSEAVFSADFPQASSHLDAKLLWPPPWLLLGPRRAYTNTHQKPTHTHTHWHCHTSCTQLCGIHYLRLAKSKIYLDIYTVCIWHDWFTTLLWATLLGHAHGWYKYSWLQLQVTLLKM